MIKIAHILHSVGGVDVSLRLITENINQDKFENIIIHGHKDTQCEFLDRKNKSIRSYKTSIYREISFFKDVNSIIKTYKILKNEKPNLIHAHSAKGGIIGRIMGFLLNINVLYTPQAFSFLSTENRLKRKIYILLEKVFTNKFSYLLASSNSERSRGIENKIFKKEKTLLFNNSIRDILEIEPLSIPKTWPDEYICTVGRPSYQKNIELMIDVLNEINKYKSVHLVVMGVGFHSDKLDVVKSKILKYNLSSKVTLIEWTQRTDIFNIIKQSKLYISTARYEGLPYSIIESLALSTPCIVTNSDGNKDLIKDGYNGYVIKNENIVDFKDKILHLLNNEQEREVFSKNSRKEFLEKYNIEKNIKNLENIYTEFSIK
ncbi:glycosyltransferase [Flavobacterium aciduliphilum]|uniref:Glycosyltransferase involved in cell wall biosynthesis n=1 Tax=Flavobacterium aciduliphilum TaxID=1101402 RepID=A0A328YIM5_9FLAO|nr:glycosyltransferase [Flavobacterium aciduliphilum]RAR72903.1 glycosyltransferase involved in cell wall biosynthesis [Flavobacterium aciduliphilum]